jgi:hypothetical protein
METGISQQYSGLTAEEVRLDSRSRYEKFCVLQSIQKVYGAKQSRCKASHAFLPNTDA